MIKRLAMLATMVLASTAQAGNADDVQEHIVEAVRTLNPALEVNAVHETPIAGLYEVVIGSQIAYFSEDGRYLIQGELIDLVEQRSMTEARLQEQRLPRLQQVPDEEFIIYPAVGETQHRVIVVTDIDCPYCRRMHGEMERINELGIEVRYLQMPRAGVASPSYRKAVSVYCNDDQNAAMDRAKGGEDPPVRDCDNPVQRHMALTAELGIRATPTVIFENGATHPGYLEAERLLEIAEQHAARSR